MPDWNELILSWHELKNLPTRWIDTLSGWRGVYFIFDAEVGKGYVGSASGKDNLFGRWKNYADTGDGGNVLLRKPRKSDKFLFSILELVSPNAEPNAVRIRENNWKDRLHTRKECKRCFDIIFSGAGVVAIVGAKEGSDTCRFQTDRAETACAHGFAHSGGDGRGFRLFSGATRPVSILWPPMSAL